MPRFRQHTAAICGLVSVSPTFFIPVAVFAGPQVPEESLTLEELARLSVRDLEKVDVIRMNLIVAKEIEPDINIEHFERLVDRMAEYVRWQIQVNQPFFEDYKDEFDGSREMWMCTLLWQILREDFGIRYLDGKNEALDHTQPWQKFVHGVLTTGQGTCCTLPVLHLGIGQTSWMALARRSDASALVLPMGRQGWNPIQHRDNEQQCGLVPN